MSKQKLDYETNYGCNYNISKLHAFNTHTMVLYCFFPECTLIISLGRSHSSRLSDGTQLSGLPDHLMFPANYHPSWGISSLLPLHSWGTNSYSSTWNAEDKPCPCLLSMSQCKITLEMLKHSVSATFTEDWLVLLENKNTNRQYKCTLIVSYENNTMKMYNGTIFWNMVLHGTFRNTTVQLWYIYFYLNKWSIIIPCFSGYGSNAMLFTFWSTIYIP